MDRVGSSLFKRNVSQFWQNLLEATNGTMLLLHMGPDPVPQEDNVIFPLTSAGFGLSPSEHIRSGVSFSGMLEKALGDGGGEVSLKSPC